MLRWGSCLAVCCLLLAACAVPEQAAAPVLETPPVALGAPAVDLYQLAKAAEARGDVAEAFRLWRALAESGDSRGQNNLGVYYHRGTVVEANTTEAIKWFRRSAEQGESQARYNLARAILKGEGIARDGAAALNLLETAAQQGDADAQNFLGVMHATGYGYSPDEAVPTVRNDALSLRWITAAAAQDHPDGLNNMGLMALKGLVRPRNIAEARTFFAKAAERGSAEARYNLGFSYIDVPPVERNDVQALRWFLSADLVLPLRSRKQQDVRYHINQLSSRLTEAQRAEARRDASSWDRRYQAAKPAS